MNTRIPKVLAIGGGTGLPTVIRGLSPFEVYLQAGVTVTDNGGDAGKFRQRDGSPSFGDYARAIVPLCTRRAVTRHFEKKISYNGDVHKVRNVIFSKRFHHFDRCFRSTIEATDAWLGMENGTGIPTTLENAHLFARLDDGSVIQGETNIDIPKHDGRKRIVDLWLEPEVMANPSFIHAIETADVIIFSPGDFYTSLVAALLPKGIMTALRRSSARKIFMLNIMSKWGETHGYHLEDFMTSLATYIGADVGHDILVNSTTPEKVILDRYHKEQSEWIYVPEDNPYRSRVYRVPLLSEGIVVRHDPDLIADAFTDLYPEIFKRTRKRATEIAFA